MDNLETMTYATNGVVIKSLGARKIEGLGLRFSNENDTDLQNEFFTEKTITALDNGDSRPLIIEHGQRKDFGNIPVAKAVFEKSEKGWAYQANFYDTPLGNKAYEEITSRKYHSSAGAVNCTTSQKGNAKHYETFLVAEMTATLFPVDIRNPVLQRIKSLQDFNANIDNFQKELLEKLEKSISAKYEPLQNLLTQLKDGFKKSGEHHPIFEIEDTDAFLAELEALAQPISLVSW